MPPLPPPVTATVDQVDDYHGELVADPYRWLEDTNDPATAVWIAEQNAVTEAFLSSVPARETIRERLAELWDYPRYGVPFERGGRWFQTRNSGLQNQSVLYVTASPEDEGRVLLDPNGFSQDGTVAVTGTAVTEDGTLLAYATSAAGSDWMTWHVREVESGLDRRDVVQWSKFTAAAWLADGSGFYYGAPDPPPPGSEYLCSTGPMRIHLHRLGTPQVEDELVYEAPEHPDWIPEAAVSEDGRYLVVSVSRGTAPETMVLVADLQAGERLHPLVGDFSCKAHVVSNEAATFQLLTDEAAPRGRLVAVDLDRPEKEHWRTLVPESDALFLEARRCGDAFVCHRLRDACSRLAVVDLDGTSRAELDLPAVVSVAADRGASAIEGRPSSQLVHFALTSFTDAGSVWQHDLTSGATHLLRAATAPIADAELVSEQVFVPADDDARLPLFLTHRKDVAPDGELAVLLTGYGGFDVPVTPEFSRAGALFAERGGVFAVAVLRGGGEYGRTWHDAGRLASKQRVFDDFAHCARFLASSGWSRPGRIAIDGASNGGLLVGASITQHPELFGAAVAEVGVLDMLRFHRFTIGWAWKSDYGDPDDPEQYRWLRAYSPLHNLRPGAHYPPTLVMTGDHDDRVVPGHSFKFAAALQAAQAHGSQAPILVRVETSAGHGFGKPTAKAIAERTDMLAFVEGALGVASADAAPPTLA